VLLTINPFYRLDVVKYFPSADPFSDETQTISQSRRLNNVGIKADVAYNHGIHNVKVGVQVMHTFLTEGFQFGITDPAFNDPDSESFIPALAPFDLTRGGNLFTFRGHTDVKQEAFYAQDLMTIHDLSLNLGVRFDNYNGISHGNLWQPRLGIAYHVKPTNTVLRFAYTRTFETPYNENLILSSATGAGGLADGILGAATNEPLQPGRRNGFNTGIQQGIGRYIIIDADYFWKYTNNAYDFNVILNTPIAFPISWSKSKLDGVAMRVNLANYKGLSAFFVAGHTRARYFPPESGGLFFNSDLPEGVFRIDHDQAFQQTTQVQYQFNQFKRLAPYVAFTWRYDSGLVAGSVPDFDTALTLTPDQQAQIGLFCGGVFATPTQGLTDCSDPNRGATRLRIPADGTANDDHNPPRITPRHLFDASVGTDNLFRTERAKVTLRLTGINLTNKEALYNFLSTFSGTHFVTPRAYQAQLGITF
jgi:outer membrane receptor for Fe3+-dicitrate